MVEPKSLAKVLLYFNLCLYTIVLSIGGWAVNYAIDHGFFIDKGFKLPAHFWPIYFTTGNATTGIFVVFSLIAGAVGVASGTSGLIHLNYRESKESVSSAAFAGIIAWILTLLAMGFACKQIDLHGRASFMKTMETFILILSATQPLLVAAILTAARPKPEQKPEEKPEEKKVNQHNGKK